MKSEIKSVVRWSLIIVILVSCKSARLQDKSTCCVETFRLKYENKRQSMTRVIDNKMYAGTMSRVFRINDKDFKWFVFGDEPDEKIALVNQNNNSLNYVSKGVIKSKKIVQEDTLFFFDKPVNYKWKVHIEGNYFNHKQFTYAGTEYENNVELYRYLVEPEEGYAGNFINKIYYNKEKGIMKFEYQTHFFPVEVKRVQ